MKTFTVWTLALGTCAMVAVMAYHGDSKEEPQEPPLDYSKPVFTVDHAVVCPLGILFDQRADHGPSAVFDMFISMFSQSSKAQALGCQELHGGIRVTAVRMNLPSDLHYVQIDGTMFGTMFTI